MIAERAIGHERQVSGGSNRRCGQEQTFNSRSWLLQGSYRSFTLGRPGIDGDSSMDWFQQSPEIVLGMLMRP